MTKEMKIAGRRLKCMWTGTCTWMHYEVHVDRPDRKESHNRRGSYYLENREESKE